MTQESMIGFLVGILLAGGGSVLYSMITGGGAKTKAKATLENATREAESKIKDADVSIKELELQRRGEFEDKQNLGSRRGASAGTRLG